MSSRLGFLTAMALVLAFAAPVATAGAQECELTPRAKCFGIESLAASLSTTQAGGHPDFSFTFDIKKDPESEPNVFGLKDAYAPTRNVRIELPPGLIGDPNVLGVPQQCTMQELLSFQEPGGGCPNGAQVGVTEIFGYELDSSFLEPIYMMEPPGGDLVARLGFIAGVVPVFINLEVRSEGDYGLTSEITDAATLVKLIRADSTIWGVPAHPSHDTERCTPEEAFDGCQVSEPRPPGSRPLPFLTNPTRCGVPLEMRVSASSWAEPQRFDTKAVSFPEITGCNRLPFGPDLTVQPTSRRAGAPTGLDVTVRLPASEGVDVLEPSQIRDIRVDLPAGLAINSSSADGLAACSEAQVRFGERVAAECPDAAKVADTEFEIPALPRRMKGAVYLREPEPGNLFRVWIVADDLGVHVKLRGQLIVDHSNGQIESIVLDVPQAPLREAKLVFKSGFRAPLANPATCGTYVTNYEFVPWSGGPPVKASTPMTIDEGCGEVGRFDPELSAGSADPSAGKHSPFLFTLVREDGEQNPASLDITLPQGLAATFRGVPLCEGAAAQTGQCPAGSRIGKVVTAVGAGPTPLWVPQPGKRPTAVYLGGPYKGAPFSIVAVVPAQAGPFDLGDEVVRSAVYVDPVRARGIVRSDPLPQFIEGIPIRYRTIHVELDRPKFVLNPTGCGKKRIEATVTSSQGAVASPSTGFRAVNCAQLKFKPKLSFRLIGGTSRGDHPKLRAVLKARKGDANIGRVSVALPRSEFLDQNHIKTVCTRAQFALDQCPAGSIYGRAVAKTPLLARPLKGPVYLRSSDNPLPDLVFSLGGEIEIELAGRIDTIDGGIRNTFDFVPDAPVSRFTLSMQGGGKGLLINSRNLCAAPYRATVKYTAHNGRKRTQRPLMKASCRKGKRRGSR